MGTTMAVHGDSGGVSINTLNSAPSGAPGAATIPPWPTYLRKNQILKPLGISDVPYHPDFGNQSSGAHPALEDFCHTIFSEANSWECTKNMKKRGIRMEKKAGPKPIEIHEYETAKGDRWFARYCELKSDDHDQHWEELEHMLRVTHSDHEAEYTPEIFHHQHILQWLFDPASAATKAVERVCDMTDLTMQITQMYHELGSPLSNRVFTVLLLSGVRSKLQDGNDKTREFITVQLPVDLSKFPDDLRSRSYFADRTHYNPPQSTNNPTGMAHLTPQQKKNVGKPLVEGYYASVEILSYVKKAAVGDNRPASDFPHIAWSMSTASNAGIKLMPRCLYKMFVPQKIAADVRLVCNHIKSQRPPPLAE